MALPAAWLLALAAAWLPTAAAAAAAAPGPLASCKVGDEVFCPGSPNYPMCSGNQCCDGGELGTFVCPSADPEWNECNMSKRYDCVLGETPKAEPGDVVPYFPHFDTSPDYLGIAARARGVSGHPGHLSDNYYLVVADWGGCGFGCCCEMQQAVAAKMAAYVRQRKKDKPNSSLLFVLAGGDNFYWNGATEGHFQHTWLGSYAPELLDVPWFAVLGNHDLGNADPTNGCPSINPRFVCNETNLATPACGGARPYSTMQQGYNSNQHNADKGGVGGAARANFQVPDYTYYYSIPELRFELIAIDWNWLAAFPGGLGGNGVSQGCGAEGTLRHCGNASRLSAELRGIQDASTELLLKRAAAASSDNVAIFSHYPDWSQGRANLRKLFLQGVPKQRREALTVFNFFGHDHYQKCHGQTEDGQCSDFLTGGGGGCCGHEDAPAGFTAISFSDQSAKQVVECFVDAACSVYYNETLI